MPPTLSSNERLALERSKLNAKKEVLNDKMDVEATIGGQTIGWQMNRATAGLAANKSHLEAAQQLLQNFEESDINKVLEPALFKRDTAIQNANREYELAVKKVTIKTETQHKLLQARVQRYEEAVKLSTESLKQLQENKPRGVIRVEGNAKKIERELQTVDEIEQMNKRQEESRHKPVDMSNTPKWLEEMGEDPELKQMRIDAAKDVADRIRKQEEEYERKKEEYEKQRRIMLAAEEQRLTDNRQKELEALRLQASQVTGKAAGLIDDKIFRIQVEDEALVARVLEQKKLEEFRVRDAEEEQRYRVENKSASESENEIAIQKEIEEAKERQRQLYGMKKPVKKVMIK